MEKENKFTKGPWMVCGNQRNGHFDFVLPTAEDKDFQANCRLIASSPDLLAACERMIPFMAKAIEVEAFKGSVIPDSARQAMLNAIDVINKAKGE